MRHCCSLTGCGTQQQSQPQGQHTWRDLLTLRAISARSWMPSSNLQDMAWTGEGTHEAHTTPLHVSCCWCVKAQLLTLLQCCTMQCKRMSAMLCAGGRLGCELLLPQLLCWSTKPKMMCPP